MMDTIAEYSLFTKGLASFIDPISLPPRIRHLFRGIGDTTVAPTEFARSLVGFDVLQ